MAVDPIRTAAAAENGVVEDTLLEAMIKRGIYVLNVGEAWDDFDQPTGEKRLAIVDAATSYLYLYDSTDTTTADDGLTCRVTGTGERYFIEDAASISLSTVLAVEDTPPGSPTVGDVYICDTASSGAWSGHDTDLAVYTRRGWVFAVPEIGMTVYDQATGANLQFDENGDWIPFAVEIADDSLRPSQLMHPAGLVVEAQQNAPPSVPGDPATTYLVGTAGSGAWTGHNNAIAFSRDGSTWSFIAATEGMTVYDKTNNVSLRYDGSSWGSIASGVVDYQTFTTPGAATWTKPSGLSSNAMVLVQAWGGGGGGGGAGSAVGGAGAGGGYAELWVRAASLASTESLSIGAGGANGGGSGAGAAGGDTTFGTWLTAYKGGAGASTLGGGGGGLMSAGTSAVEGVSAGAGGNPSPSAGGAMTYAGGGNGSTTGGDSWFGGGGGASTNGGRGGNSRYGGGGGAAGLSSAAGTSKFGGNGGASNTNGAAPGGGGGGRPQNGVGGNGGTGARGEIRVTVFS